MYLTAKKYLSSWQHNGDDLAKVFKETLEAAGIDLDMVDQGSPSGSLEFHIGYWRKANAIHNWFVQYVQGGEDECNPHGVSLEQLVTLKKLCQKILKKRNNENVKKLVEDELPPSAGFFFGSTAVDEYYFHDLEHTVEVIERCEKLSAKPKKKGDYGWDFEYQSSW